MVSAADNNYTQDAYDDKNENVENSQHIVNNGKIETEYNTKTDNNKSIVKNENNNQIKTSTNTNAPKELVLNVSVVNQTVNLVSDADKEVAITKNITTVNGVPDVTKLGVDYAYVDENGTYTIAGSEIRRVMRLDSYCQEIYGFTPRYTFFRAIGSNVKYVISREKWNVIARSLNGYHVNQGYTAVNTPYAVTVNLSGKSRFYNVYYDAQEWINGQQYTCGPTAMSMISQALNCYASEKRLAGLYATTASDGTDESKIIRYSPTAHMKMTNIANTEASVKSAIKSGKMVFWHIRGHYMCVVGYNDNTGKFLCLNPSGPSHNINAVQWATWTVMMKTDRPLKENGFMAVTPYWNLTAANKTHAKYYYYNMGGKYTTPSNSEYCNGGYDNKVKVTANAPSSLPTKTNQTILKISSEIRGVNGVIDDGKIALYLDSHVIKSANVQNGIVSINYTVPAYTPDNITITSKYITSSNVSVGKVKTSFNRFVVGKKYTNSIKFNYESISVDSVTAKKDDVVTFTAYVMDAIGNPVSTGKVVFKLNGNTIKRNGNPVKVKVVDGLAEMNFTVPSYSAKTYKLTAVFGNDTTRMENHATLSIQKLKTNIINTRFIQDNNTGYLIAQVVDEHGDNVERDTKISVKINGKTVIKQVKVKNGLVNMTLKLSNYKTGNHSFMIIAGENGLYQSSRINKTFAIVHEEPLKVQPSITNLNVDEDGNLVKIQADIVDDKGNNLKNDVKISIKLDGKTLRNKAVISGGVVYESLDVSGYKEGVYDLSLIVGENSFYKSCVLDTKVSIS